MSALLLSLVLATGHNSSFNTVTVTTVAAVPVVAVQKQRFVQKQRAVKQKTVQKQRAAAVTQTIQTKTVTRTVTSH